MARKPKKEAEPEMEEVSFYYGGALPKAEPNPLIEYEDNDKICSRPKEIPNCIVIRLNKRLESVNDRLDSIVQQRHQYGEYSGREPFFQEIEAAKKSVESAKSKLKGDRIAKLKLAIRQLEQMEKL